RAAPLNSLPFNAGDNAMTKRHAIALSFAAALSCAPVAANPADDLRAAVERGDYPKTTRVIVMRDGKPVYEQYFGDGAVDRLNDTRSAMKAITALAVGAAISDRAIPSVQAPAFSYLADLKPFRNDTADKEAITLADMMSMSSALDCDDNVDASPGNEDKMHDQANWTRWSVDLPTMAGYARDATGQGPWRYCTVNAVLTGQVLQRATHMPVDEYIERRILSPLGISKWEWPRSPSGEAMTGGGLRLRTRDLAAIAAMMAGDGVWQGHRILPASWIDAMLTVRRASRPDQNYGYFVFQGTYKSACGPLPAWYMAGNGGSQILILRPLHAAIVVTRENYNVAGTSFKTVEMIEKYLLPMLPCSKPA